MSYGYPGPGGQQQPQQQPQPPPPQWQGQQPPPPGWQYPAGPGWGGPPLPPPKSNTGKIIGFSCLGIVGVVALFIVLGIVGYAVSDGKGSSSKDSGTVAEKPATRGSSAPAASEEPKEESGPEDDVKITACEVDSLTTWASADVLITNRSSEESNYIVNVEFVDSSGKRLGEALAATNNLAPGQKSEQKAQGLDDIKGKIECKVTDVTRYAS